MPIRPRTGSRPFRPIAGPDALTLHQRLSLLARVSYEGSGLHKLRPGDYGFVPSHNPRPTKSVCDDLRPMLKEQARSLFREAIELGMTSPHSSDSVPKYVWAVDEHGEPFEAKTKPGQETVYHGYRLGEDEREMRRMVLKEWRKRCSRN